LSTTGGASRNGMKAAASGALPTAARPSGIARPPWEELGVEGYLPATAAGGGENTTEPVMEQTMGPLLIWAMRMVEALPRDIFVAQAERQRIIEAARAAVPTTGGKAALETAHVPQP